MNIIDKIGEAIFNFNFYWEYERPLRRHRRYLDSYMSGFLEKIRKVAEQKETMSSEEKAAEAESCFDQEHIEKRKAEFERLSAEVEALQEKILEYPHFCYNIKAFEAAVETGSKHMVLYEEAYEIWKPYMRAAEKKKKIHTISATENWFASFGYAPEIVALSNKVKKKQIILVYTVKEDTELKRILFSRIN